MEGGREREGRGGRFLTVKEKPYEERVKRILRNEQVETEVKVAS